MTTVYSDIILRHGVISSDIHGKESFKNDRVTTDSGAQYVNQVWSRSMREYTFATIPMLREDWDYLRSIFGVTRGGAYGFLLEDPTDYHTTSETVHVQTLGVMASLGGGTYQLYKRYLHIASGRYEDRKTTRIEAASFQAFDGAGGTLVASVDPDTGIATIAGTPASWSGRFYVPVQFQSDAIDWTLEASGPPEARLWSGPSVVLEEIRE